MVRKEKGSRKTEREISEELLEAQIKGKTDIEDKEKDEDYFKMIDLKQTEEMEWELLRHSQKERREHNDYYMKLDFEEKEELNRSEGEEAKRLEVAQKKRREKIISGEYDEYDEDFNVNLVEMAMKPKAQIEWEERQEIKLKISGCLDSLPLEALETILEVLEQQVAKMNKEEINNEESKSHTNEFEEI